MSTSISSTVEAKWSFFAWSNNERDVGLQQELFCSLTRCPQSTVLAGALLPLSNESLCSPTTWWGEDVKVKAHELFYGYYLNLIQYERDCDRKHIKWLVENLKNEPDDERPWDWERYGFIRDELYCDYGPDMGLYLILYNAGVPRRDVSSICPWKTGISIRFEDNAVFYNTYQHRDEIGV